MALEVTGVIESLLFAALYIQLHTCTIDSPAKMIFLVVKQLSGAGRAYIAETLRDGSRPNAMFRKSSKEY